jgi:hypothetical protein
MRKRLWLIAILLPALFLAGCGKQESQEPTLYMSQLKGFWIIRNGGLSLQITPKDTVYADVEIAYYDEDERLAETDNGAAIILPPDYCLIFVSDSSDAGIMVFQYQNNDKLLLLSMLLEDKFGYAYNPMDEDDPKVFERRR